MKRSITSKSKMAMLSLAICLGLTTLAPRPAHAFFLVAIPTAMATNNHFGLDISNMDAPTMFICAIFLPVCILDQKGSAPQSELTTQDLTANGYTQDQAQDLISQTQQLTEALNATGQRAVIGSSDTVATVAPEVRKILPQASDLFVQFLIDRSVTK